MIDIARSAYKKELFELYTDSQPQPLGVGCLVVQSRIGSSSVSSLGLRAGRVLVCGLPIDKNRLAEAQNATGGTETIGIGAVRRCFRSG